MIENSQQDTIVAIATPQGNGGIGIIRISGDRALEIAQNVIKKNLKPRYATFCNIYDEDDIIDNAIVIHFNAPFSYTGEDVIEIQAHGNPHILNLIINITLKYGARLARAGEFTERACLNDKIDLAQAEAVADIINASSEMAAKSAARSLSGDFSKEINSLLENLIYLRMYIEASIDFPEEEIDFLADKKISTNLNKIIQNIKNIRNNCKQGIILREGIKIVLVGKPNVGKSSLLNRLSGNKTAIVTDIAGTTRDVIKESIQVNGVPVNIIDTAGLRNSSDIVENEGIKRTLDNAKEADLILYISDDHQNIKCEDIKSIIPDFYDRLPKDIPTIYVHNKIDTLEDIPKNINNHIYISARGDIGINELKNEILDSVGYTNENESVYTARQRHIDAINNAYEHIILADNQLQNGSGELLAEELLIAQEYLNMITGEFSSDDLLGEIFSSFCIGK